MIQGRSTGKKQLDWYNERLRRFLVEHAPDDAAAIDRQKPRVEQLLATAEDEVAVCFLGMPGLGKAHCSTL